MRIVNCLPYFNERELLELRIRSLESVVDFFVITEGDRTHTGDPKPYTAQGVLDDLGIDPSRYVVVHVELPCIDHGGDRARENAQRDAASAFIKPDDVAFITDGDEIMNPEFVKYYAMVARSNPDKILRIPMAFLNARADFQVLDENKQPRKWNAAYVCMKHHSDLYRLSQMREAYTLKNYRVTFPDIFTVDHGRVLDAGWHFSWMGKNTNKLTKWNSFAELAVRPVIDGAAQDIPAHIMEYTPQVYGTDPLGRSDHLLGFYHWNELPKKLFGLPRVKEYLLPGTKIDHFYFRPEMGEFWFTFPNLYRSMVERFPSGSKFVEVGVWKGRSAAFMCTEIANAGKQIEFTCIDHWEGSSEHQEVNKHELKSLYEIYSKNMEPVKGLYRDMKMPSLEAVKHFEDGSLKFCFIDAAHEYELFKEDFQAWLPKMAKGGVIAGHDCYPDNPEFGGVFKALQELIPGKFSVSENCWIHEVK